MHHLFAVRKTLLPLIAVVMAMLLGAYASAEEAVHSGTVIATEVAGRYTYIQLAQDPDGEEVWIAAGVVVSAGERIEYMGGVPMREFYSSSLDRTFEQILFVSNIRKIRPEGAEGADTALMPDDEYHRGLADDQAEVMPPQAGEIALSGEEIAIADVYARHEQLDGQGVKLRAKVLKVSRNILGKHWVTLSDGTGEAPEDKLLATTLQEGIVIGDTVSVGGVVKAGADLGSGYQYKVILEEAVFQP